jgi:hypothetical protein
LENIFPRENNFKKEKISSIGTVAVYPVVPFLSGTVAIASNTFLRVLESVVPVPASVAIRLNSRRIAPSSPW